MSNSQSIRFRCAVAVWLMAAVTFVVLLTPRGWAQASANGGDPCHVYILCDDEGELFVNGTSILKMDNWARVFETDCVIKPGDIVAVVVTDKQGGPGGRFAFLALKNNTPFISSKNFHYSTVLRPDWQKNPSLNGFHHPLVSPLRNASLGDRPDSQQAWAEKQDIHFATLYFKCIVP